MQHATARWARWALRPPEDSAESVSVPGLMAPARRAGSRAFVICTRDHSDHFIREFLLLPESSVVLCLLSVLTVPADGTGPPHKVGQPCANLTESQAPGAISSGTAVSFAGPGEGTLQQQQTAFCS